MSHDLREHRLPEYHFRPLAHKGAHLPASGKHQEDPSQDAWEEPGARAEKAKQDRLLAGHGYPNQVRLPSRRPRLAAAPQVRSARAPQVGKLPTAEPADPPRLAVLLALGDGLARRGFRGRQHGILDRKSVV